MSTLLLPEERIRELGEEAELGTLKGEGVVLLSSVTVADPDGADKAQYEAALATSASSAEAKVPHVFMTGHQTQTSVIDALAASGSYVIPLADGEGGLAAPYYTGSLLCDEYFPDALLVKVEGEKNLAANPDNLKALLAAAEQFDVITGVRTLDTFGSMPYYLATTESLLGLAIRDITGPNHDTPSGVLAMTKEGREAFRKTQQPDWGYLIATPWWAKRWKVRVGEADVDFRYHPAVVKEQNGNPKFDKKRRDQLELMLVRALQLAGGTHRVNRRQLQAYHSGMALLKALTAMAGTSK